MKYLFTVMAIALFTCSFSQTGGSVLNYSNSGIEPGALWQQELVTPGNPWWRGFDMNVSVLPGLVIGGAGHFLGSEVTIFSESSWREDLPENVFFNTRNDYGDLTVPIITNPDSQLPFILDLGYTIDETRLGLSWFRMSGQYDQSGMVPGLNFYDETGLEGFGFGFVSFWNMGWDLHLDRGFPASWIEGFRDHGEIENGLNDDLDYDLDFFPEKGNTLWEASNNISFNSFQLTARHPVIQNDNLRLSLAGGIQYGRWSDNLRQMVNITAHTELTDRWVQMVPVNNEEQDSLQFEVFFTYIFHNDITLETNSSSEFNSFGLLGGFEAAWRVTPSLSLLIGAGASTLSGNVSYHGSGIDIDDIDFRETYDLFDMDGNQFPFDPEVGYEFLSGVFDLPGYTNSLLSVNYNMSFSASYDLTNNISLTAGYYYTIWTNLPLSPQWSYSDQRTTPYNAFAVEESWNMERKANISASGFRLGVGFRF